MRGSPAHKGCIHQDVGPLSAMRHAGPHALLRGIKTALSPFNSTHAPHQPWAGSVAESQCVVFDGATYITDYKTYREKQTACAFNSFHASCVSERRPEDQRGADTNAKRLAGGREKAKVPCSRHLRASTSMISNRTACSGSVSLGRRCGTPCQMPGYSCTRRRSP
jgi:hypothetical protein